MALNVAEISWQPEVSADTGFLPPIQIPGDGHLPRHWQHAPKTQDAVTVEGAELIDYKVFFGDMRMEDWKGSKDLAPASDAAPIGPIINSVLRVRGTGTELRNLALGLYALPQPARGWRLTNRQDTTASVIISIEFTLIPNNVPDNVLFITPRRPITIESNPTPKRTLRDLLELHAVLRALREPRVIEIADTSTSQVLFIGHGVQIDGFDSAEDQFIDVLRTIQSTFSTKTFPVPGPLQHDEMQKALRIAEILRSGQVTQPIDTMSAEVNVETTINMLRYVDKNGVLQHVDEHGVSQEQHMHIEQLHTEHTLFGVPLDLGPSRADYPPMKLTRRPEELRKEVARLSSNSLIAIVLAPVDPKNNEVHYQYKRYWRALVNDSAVGQSPTEPQQEQNIRLQDFGAAYAANAFSPLDLTEEEGQELLRRLESHTATLEQPERDLPLGDGSFLLRSPH